jgi:hypothetical protein
MDSALAQIYILDKVIVTISPKDLAKALKTRANATNLLETAYKLLSKIHGKWHPRAVFRWLLVTEVNRDTVSLKTIDKGESRRLYLGFAGRFMTRSKFGIVAVFTAGAELESWPVSKPGFGAWLGTE